MESSGAGAHVALATPTPVSQSLNDMDTKMDFDSLAWMGLDDPAHSIQEPTLLQSPFNDTFVNNPFQSSNVRQSLDENVADGAQGLDQPVTAPMDFSQVNHSDSMNADAAAPALPFDASFGAAHELDAATTLQDIEPFNFDDTWTQPPLATEASQAFSEPEPEEPDIAEMNGFAQISFQDGEFLVTSTQVILGRDDKFAKKYQQELKLAKRRVKEGSRQAKEVEAQEALHEYQQEPSQPSGYGDDLSPNGSALEGRPARGLASAYSEQGGIVGLPQDERRRRRKNKKRRHLLLSGQSSSTTSVAPANLHTFKYDVETGDDDDEDAQKPVFLPVHPNNPADIKLISREHLQIEYNDQTSRWELKILGRSAYVKNEHYHVEVEGADTWEECEPKLLEREEVAVLTHLTEIIVASLRMQFRLPTKNKVVSTFDSDSELSDAISSPSRPTSKGKAGLGSDDSELSSEDDAPLQAIKEKKLKKQKKKEEKAKGGKSGKKPVMLNLKKRKDSEVSPVKAAPVTPKQPEKGKKPKKTVVAGSEPQPEVPEKKEPPKQPMQLHLPPPPPTQEQLDEQATIQALTQPQLQSFESAPPETPMSGISAGPMYAPAPQTPAEPVSFEPGSMLSEVPMDQLPEKRKGPGRPPKNGLISKRDMGIIRRKQKEFEKQGIQVPPLDELVRIVRTENKAKEAAAKAAARGEAPPPMAQNFPIMQSIEMSQEPSATPTYVPAVPTPMPAAIGGEGDYVPADPEAKGSPKRARTYRSPSPMKSKEDCTEEELKKPNHTYYTTLDEILSEGPPEGLELQQIYDKICKKYPYYRYGVEGHGWQSSVRHNLKQHERFQQVTKQGKGWLWAINQEIPFDKEKKRKPTPPPSQRPPMGYPMPNGMAPQPGMQQYGNPYAYGQTMPNGQTQYQQPPPQPGQQYSSPYGQPGQQQYAQPGAPQYIPAGSQPPANAQYPYQPQQQQGQPQPYPPNGAPQPPVPGRSTSAGHRQGSGTPHPQPYFSNLVEEIMAYRSDYLRPYTQQIGTPLYKEHEDVFKKCVEWISELQSNGTPQLNFANDQEQKVFTDLERIMRKYQNNGAAPTSAPAPNTSQPAGPATTAGAPAPTNVNGGVATAPTTVDATTTTNTDTAGVKRPAPDDGDSNDAKRMKVEGEGADQGMSMSTSPTYTATAGTTAGQQFPPTTDMSTQPPAMDNMTTQATTQATEPVFDFSNPSAPHDPQEPVFDFSTPDHPGQDDGQPVFDFSDSAMDTVPAPASAPVEQQTQPPQPYAQPAVDHQQSQPVQQQQYSQPHSQVPTPQQQQPYAQPQAQQASNVSTPQPAQAYGQAPQQQQQQYSQPQPYAQPQVQQPGAAPTTQPPQAYTQAPQQTPTVGTAPQPAQPYSQAPPQPPSAVQTAQPVQASSQTLPQAPNPVPAPQQQTQTYAPSPQAQHAAPTPQPQQVAQTPQALPQNQTAATTTQPVQAPSQPMSQPPSAVTTPQPAQAYAQPPSQPPSVAPTPQPAQAYAQPPSQPPSAAPTPQPVQSYAPPPSHPPSAAPTPQPVQAYSQPTSQPPSAAPTPQPVQSYAQPPSQPTSTVPTPQPAQATLPQPAQTYSQPPSVSSSAAPTPQPAQVYPQQQQQPSRPQSAVATPQPVQYHQPQSQPSSAAQTPQPTQYHQPPSNQNSNAASSQQVQQPSSHHPTPSQTPAPSTPLSVEHAVEAMLPVVTSEYNTPTGSGTGGQSTPVPQT